MAFCSALKVLGPKQTTHMIAAPARNAAPSCWCLQHRGVLFVFYRGVEVALMVKLEGDSASQTCQVPLLRSEPALPVADTSALLPLCPPQFHAVAVSNRPQLATILPKLSPSQHVAALSKQLLHCMACYQLLQFKGSMLALAIVSLELEKLLPDWLALIIELLQKAQVRRGPRAAEAASCSNSAAPRQPRLLGW